MTLSDSPTPAVSLAKLSALYEACRPKAYINEADAGNSIVEMMRGNGYAVEARRHMPKGKLWFEDAGGCGLVDLVAGTAVISDKNPELEFLKQL